MRRATRDPRRPPRPRRLPATGAALLAGALAVACGGSERAPEMPWTPGTAAGVVRTSTLQAGPGTVDPTARNPYEGDGLALATGRTVYEGFNCAGCHGTRGGGGIGPPFADTEWIYGDAPENIYQSVAQGRPNGMPAFGSRMSEESLWQLVAYVRSLGPRGETSGAGGGAASGGTVGGRQPGGGPG